MPGPAAGLSPNIGASPLDSPPPSPTAMGAAGATGPFTPQGLTGAPGAQQTIPSDQLPPEVLTGIMQAAQKISALLDSFAQVTPDKGAQLGMIKDLLARYLADITSAGSGPISPTASGQAPPMGGLDRGIASGGPV
jgi:hypothetical protein